MATKIARATGNLTDPLTWGAVDATVFLDSEAANTLLTTAYVESVAGTPGAIIIDGLAVKVRTRSATPTGTISVRIAQAGVTVAGTEVIVNVADISTDVQDNAGWLLVQFAPVTLAAATLYTVSAKTSSANQVTLYRDATAGNWSRMVRTTTTGAPAAGDNFFILGQWTAAGVKTNVTVTMDSTVATDYGANSTSLAGVGIGNGGALVWATAAGTNYILQLSCLLAVYYGGIYTQGGIGTECPRTSTMTLQFDCAAAGDFGFYIFGSVTIQGLSRTVGKNVVQCLLAADVAAAGATLTVNADTGWLGSDDIAIATTTRTATQGETRTLNGNAGASSFVVSVGVTNAHSGTSPTQAEVILLTRNCKVRAVTSAALYSFISIGTIASVDCDWTEFRFLGGASTPKKGIEINTTTGTVALSYCAFREALNGGITVRGTTWNNVALDNLCLWASQASGQPGLDYTQQTTGTNWSVIDCTLLSNTTTNQEGFSLANTGGTVARLRAAGWGGIGFLLSPPPSQGPIRTTWTGFELHSCGNGGFSASSNIAGQHVGKLLNMNVWRNAAATGGIFIAGRPGRLVIEGGNVFGNSTPNVYLGNSPIGLEFRNMTFAGDTTFSVFGGIRFNQSNSFYRIVLENCTFGVVAGIKTAHTGGDLDMVGTNLWVELDLLNTLLASATPIISITNAVGQSVIRYQRVNQASGVHKTVFAQKGTLALETVTFRTAAPSEKLTPATAYVSDKLESSIVEVPVDAAQVVNVSAWVQKDAAYNGNPPRLMARANAALGQTTDLVLDTYTLGSGVWEQLTGTLPAASEAGAWEIYVDCDGTAGNVYIDDYS